MAATNTTPPALTAKDRERFWSHVDRSDPDGCWPWTRGRDKDGYGKFKAQRRHFRAHRVAVFLVTGKWTEVGMHCCDNPPCCHVDEKHAQPGTRAENTADMVRKGRGAVGELNARYTHPENTARGLRQGMHTHPEKRCRGEKNGFAKLTDDDVRVIRVLRAEDGQAYQTIADSFGVVKTTIARILTGRGWRHVV